MGDTDVADTPQKTRPRALKREILFRQAFKLPFQAKSDEIN